MRSLIPAGLGLFAILALAACGGGNGASPDGGSAPPPSESAAAAACEPTDGAGDVAADASGFAFSPEPVTATVGQAITWTNGDAAPHTVTLDEGGCTTPQFSQGQTGTLRFNAPGSYPYHCEVHPSMTGTIEVSG